MHPLCVRRILQGNCAIITAVLGSETSNLSPMSLESLEGFHIRAASGV
jgi:hypothetical protein